MELVAFAVALGMAVPAQAPATAKTTPAGTFEVLGIKLTSGIQNKEAVDEKNQFNTGEKAWLWLKLKPTGDATLRLRWSKDGEQGWTMEPAKVRLGRTWYYKTLRKPGSWKVEVLDSADKVVSTKTFTVTGEPTAAAPAPSGAATAESAKVESSTKLSVVELKFSEQIQDRNPVTPSSSFAKGAKVYTWMKLEVKEAETQVKVRWLVDDKVIHTSDAVTVKQSTGWRTWQYKTVENPGNWSVQVVDADGKVVHAAPFTVN